MTHKLIQELLSFIIQTFGHSFNTNLGELHHQLYFNLLSNQSLLSSN